MKLRLKGVFLVMNKVMNLEYPSSQVQQNAPLESTTNSRVNIFKKQHITAIS